jgi:hypothetical protein
VVPQANVVLAVEVCIDDWLVVHDDGDVRPPGGDNQVIPAVLVRDLLDRRDGVVQGSAAVLVASPAWIWVSRPISTLSRGLSVRMKTLPLPVVWKLAAKDEVAKALPRAEATSRRLADERDDREVQPAGQGMGRRGRRPRPQGAAGDLWTKEHLSPGVPVISVFGGRTDVGSGVVGVGP